MYCEIISLFSSVVRCENSENTIVLDVFMRSPSLPYISYLRSFRSCLKISSESPSSV